MPLTRRSLLIGAGAASVAGALSGCTSAAESVDSSSSPLPAPSGSAPVATVGPDLLAPLQLFANQALNQETLFAFGAAAVQASDVGEMLRIVQTINQTTGNPADLTTEVFDAYYDGFGAYGDQLAAAASATSSPVSKRQRLQRAAMYATLQTFFVLGTSAPDRELGIAQVCQDRFDQAAALFQPPADRFTVSTSYGEVPGYFFRPADNDDSRPTMILSNGSDGQNIEMLAFGIIAGLQRGYNIAIFEGPGQMLNLFDRQIPFTPNWDEVVGAVYDWVKDQKGVSKVGLVGISFGGMLCARAAAKVRGLAAVVLEPGAYRDADLWQDQEAVRTVREALTLPPEQQQAARQKLNTEYLGIIPSLPKETQFNIAKRGEIYNIQTMLDARAGKPTSDYFGVIEAILQFDFQQDYEQITIPTMITENQGDIFFAEQGAQAFKYLTNVPDDQKVLQSFTVEQGTQLHDQPNGPTSAQEDIFDWLDRYLR
jgi:pimeloyl-ACP methyl ester carboxylesterase